ncbi:trypsin-like peptidase domain-containing protein [Clostridium sp.]|uniref:S1C family serine protease n=1 Tax=Clostridium sp. TaxID=1506 RepID=UPI002FCA46DE
MDNFEKENEKFNTMPEGQNMNYNNNNYDNSSYNSFNNTENYNKPYVYPDKQIKRQKGTGRFGSVIAVALICSLLGGAVGGAVTYTTMKRTGTPVKQNQNVVGNTSITPTATGTINIPEIATKVSPAVVGVSTKSVSSNIFGFNMGEQEGIGSGFIFSEDGYVLTNFHVISSASQVKVIFNNGKEVNAKIVNYNQEADLAVLKITDDVELPGVVTLGDSESLQVGEQVVAIGNPLGKEYLGSVTTGIVSAVSRDVEIDGKKMNLIQTDTAINPGNSGGPLINSKGEVVGINTAKLSGEGIEGIGFSIPINDVTAKLENLVKQKIRLGITVQNVTKDLAERYSIPVGIYITNVDNFSIAQKGGLQPGDVIVKFDGKKVETVEELNKIKDTHKDGDTIAAEFVRNGQNMTANLKIE